jgi:dolichol kinase/membrane-associated phospholipid phosphatase
MSAKLYPSALFSCVVVFAVASFLLDDFFFKTMPLLRFNALDAFFTIITNFWFVFALFVAVPCVALLFRNQASETLFLLTAFASSTLIGLLLKMLIAKPRPEQMLFEVPSSVMYSFPSSHALLVFAMLPLLVKHFPRWRYLFFPTALLVCFSRVYFGVHYLSDVVWGSLLGYGIGWYIAQEHSQSKMQLTPLELRRKVFHIAFGCILAFLLYAGYLNALFLGILLAVGIVLSFVEKKHRLPFLSTMLDIFEREGHRKTFPAKGMLMFLGGVFLATLLFPQQIALAAIMVLTFGDSVSHMFGIHFGRVHNPLAEQRFIEGAFAGIIAGFFGALFFVPPLQALVASTAAMLAEAIEFNIPRLTIDDNILVPLVAGASLLVLGTI